MLKITLKNRLFTFQLTEEQLDLDNTDRLIPNSMETTKEEKGEETMEIKDLKMMI